MASQSCIFCNVVAGTVESDLILRNSVAVAFLDHRPVFKGHTLVVPTSHVPTLIDLADPGAFFEHVQAVTRAVEAGLGCDGAFIAVNHRVSQSVPHLHVHVVPRHKSDGLRGFFWPRTRYVDAQEASTFARKITAAAG